MKIYGSPNEKQIKLECSGRAGLSISLLLRPLGKIQGANCESRRARPPPFCVRIGTQGLEWGLVQPHTGQASGSASLSAAHPSRWLLSSPTRGSFTTMSYVSMHCGLRWWLCPCWRQESRSINSIKPLVDSVKEYEGGYWEISLIFIFILALGRLNNGFTTWMVASPQFKTYPHSPQSYFVEVEKGINS